MNLEAESLEITYGDDSRGGIPLGEERFFFIFDVPQRHLEIAHASEMKLTARDSQGRVRAQASSPADWDAPAVSDESQPLVASTRSDSPDFSKVHKIEGHVRALGAVSLELRYQGGAEATIPIERELPLRTAPFRVDDFVQPQLLVAFDRRGKVVALAPVTAVAYWVGRERGR